MLPKKPAGDDQFRLPRKDPGEMQRHHVPRERALVGLQLIIAVGQDIQHVHNERVAIEIRPCGGSLGEGLERLGTAKLVRRRAGDEPHLGVAAAHRRLIAFAGMDDRGPAESEAIVVSADFDLGIAHLLDEEAIAGLNLRLAAEMPNEIGNRQQVRGLTEIAFGDRARLTIAVATHPRRPRRTSFFAVGMLVDIGGFALSRRAVSVASRQAATPGDYPNLRDRYICLWRKRVSTESPAHLWRRGWRRSVRLGANHAKSRFRSGASAWRNPHRRRAGSRSRAGDPAGSRRLRSRRDVVPAPG